MERRQFLRRTALLSLAATAAPGIAFAGKDTFCYENANARLKSGLLVVATVFFNGNEQGFREAKPTAPFKPVLVVKQDPKDFEDKDKGTYHLERVSEPAQEGDYTVATFKVVSQEGKDLMKDTLPKRMGMKLKPGEEVLLELQPGNFISLLPAEMCFLTTACTAARGLADDCPELTILRGLRDAHMRPSPEGSALVEEYYRIAPRIVRQVNASSNREAIWNLVYTDLVQPAVELILTGKKQEAVQHYTEYVSWMTEAFLRPRLA